MSDKWMNIGHDGQDLKPYSEPVPDFKDERRIGTCALLVSCCLQMSLTIKPDLFRPVAH